MNTPNNNNISSAEVIQAYMVCALWSSTDDSSDPLDANYDLGDISPELAASMMSDCENFVATNNADLQESGQSSEQIGHDFWLTRNHHGAGFWDRGLGEVGEHLTKAAQVFPEVDLYVGDDGKVYQ